MKKILIVFLLLGFLLTSCNDDEGGGFIINRLILNVQFPELPVPPDNPLTDEGVQLGRMLFYEKQLSSTSTISCASCHHQELAFSDSNPVSFGVDDRVGTRQAMPLFNLAYTENGFFWDGRTDILRHQSLQPIQDELEMDESLANVIEKLSNEEMYPNQFALAFGDRSITEERIGLALEQFLTSMVSDNSKYDQFKRDEVELTESELSGQQLFVVKNCINCHLRFNFDDDENRFLNNGLDAEEDIQDFGRELVTGNRQDRAKFKVPSLRNIEVTAPYMHDGRFQTLEEVLDHYASGGKASQTTDGSVRGGFDLTNDERRDLINFLKTLTDDDFLTNPELASPF